jgi:NHS family xanthosine MFS transporter
MLAWVLRFGLFAYGNPTSGLWMIIMSCLFMEWHLISLIFQDPYLLKRPIKNRSSAQGLFMMMTNGFGCGF